MDKMQKLKLLKLKKLKAEKAKNQNLEKFEGGSYDDANHKYYDLKGREIDSVTTIIAKLGLSPDFSKVSNIAFYAQRGKALHRGHCE